MKKIILLLILLGVLAVCVPGASTAANSLKSTNVILQQTVPPRHIVYKKRKVKRHAVTGKSARAQMQLQQAQKHLADEQKVQEAQQQLKKDTSKSN